MVSNSQGFAASSPACSEPTADPEPTDPETTDPDAVAREVAEPGVVASGVVAPRRLSVPVEASRAAPSMRIEHDGLTLARVGLSLTVFFEGAHDPFRRAAVVRTVREYESAHAEHLRWRMDPTTARWHGPEDAPIPDVGECLRKLGPERGWVIGVRGGNHPSEASTYGIEASGVPAWESTLGAVGHLRLTMPLDHDAIAAMPEIFRTICSRLHAVRGYAGLAILESQDLLARRRAAAEVHALSLRFPGLLRDDALLLPPADDGTAVPSTHWLTAVHDKLVRAAGGSISLIHRLGDDFAIVDYTGGIIIRAGEHPPLGDEGSPPPCYRRLAQALRPRRTGSYGTIRDAFPSPTDDAVTGATFGGAAAH